MPSKVILAAVVVVIVIVAGAGLLLMNGHTPRSTSTIAPKTNATSSTIRSNSTQSNGKNQSNPSEYNSVQPSYSKLLVGQSITEKNFVVTLDEITSINSQQVAVLNVSTNYNFSRTVGQRQYSNLGAFYLAVDQINATASPPWVTVGLLAAVPSGFSNATFNGGNFSNQTNYYYNVTPARQAGVPANMPSCGTSNVMFTTLPIPLSDIENIEPLGTVNSHIYPTDHVYFGLQRNAGVPVNTPVSSPGNMTIYQIAGARYKTSTGAVYNDYSLHFASCDNFSGFFGHVYTISNKLLGNFTPPYKQCINYTEVIQGWGLTDITYCIKDVSVNVTAGEHLGTAGGVAGGSEALDFQTSDYRQTPLYFANQTRNQGELYIACGLDYFTSSLRNELFQYVGGYGRDGFQRRTVPPLCGTISQDIAGTAQGDWANPRRANASYPDAGTFALMHDAVDPSMLTFSLGGGAIPGIDNDIWLTFSTSSSGYVNRAFSDVTADGHIYCYDNLQNEYGSAGFSGTILMQLMNANTLRVEYQSAGSCSGNENFASNHVDFYR